MRATCTVRPFLPLALSLALASCSQQGPTYEWVLRIDQSWKEAVDREEIVDDLVDALRRRLDNLDDLAREFELGVRSSGVARAGDDRFTLRLSGPEADKFDIEPVVRRSELELTIVTDGTEFMSLLPELEGLLSAASADIPTGSLTALFDGSLEDGEFTFTTAVADQVRMLFAPPAVSNRIPDRLRLAWISEVAPTRSEATQYLYILNAEPIITNEHLTDATASFDDDFGLWRVDFELTRDGGDLLEAATVRHIGDRMAILLDGELLGHPSVIQARIRRRGQIQMGRDGSEAIRLAAALRSGSLPAPLVVVEKRLVTPQ